MSIILATAQTVVDQGTFMQDLQAPSGIESAQKFLNTPVGKLVTTLSAAAAIFFIFGGVLKGSPLLMSGKIPKGIGMIAGGLLAGALLISPNLTLKATQAFAKWAGLGVESADSISDQDYSSMGPGLSEGPDGTITYTITKNAT